MVGAIFVVCGLAIGAVCYAVGFIEGQKQAQPKRDKHGRFIKED
jgi:hypothetical protein